MGKKLTIIGIIICILATAGCGKLSNSIKNSIAKNEEILIGVDGVHEIMNVDRLPYSWEEIDSTRKFGDIRDMSDKILGNIAFGDNSKNGPIFVNGDGSWIGNTCMMKAYKNKEYIDRIDDLNEVYKVKNINSYTEWAYEYFNLGSTKSDGTIDFNEYLSRVEAMAIIARACNSVSYIEKDERQQFFEQFGFAEQACLVDDYAYISYKNSSLSKENAMQRISCAEVAYIICNMFFSDEVSNANIKGLDIADCEKLLNVKGEQYRDYYLEYCILTEGKVEKELAKSWVVFDSKKLGYKEAYQGVTISELIKILDNTFRVITDKDRITCSVGKYESVKKVVVAEVIEEPEVEEEVEDVEEKEEITIEIGESELIIKDYEERKDIRYVIESYKEQIILTDEEKEDLIKENDAYTFLVFRADAIISHTGGLGLNVRYGPSIEHKILTALREGAKVKILGRCDDTGWYIVEYEGMIYFQCDRYLELVD